MFMDYTLRMLKTAWDELELKEYNRFFYSGNNIDFNDLEKNIAVVDSELIKTIKNKYEEIVFGPAFNLNESRLHLIIIDNDCGKKGFAHDSMGIYTRTKPIGETKTLMAAVMTARLASMNISDMFAAEDYLIKKIHDYYNFRKDKK